MLYTIEGSSPKKTHAQIPTSDLIGKDRLRIYYATRDRQNRSHTEFIDVRPDRPDNIIAIHDSPVLSPGGLGTFDDCGAMPSWIVSQGGRKYLYYIGWNVRNTIPYHNSIGMAVSEDGGDTFHKISEGPIIERTHTEPHFSSTPCVIIDSGVFRMWYLSCVKWAVFHKRAEPYYHIKYAQSIDGIHWIREGRVAIDFKDLHECAISRPCVVKDDTIYRMWYSYRNLEGYRTDMNNSYRIGYAESSDGMVWTRRDGDVGISVSEAGWDSEMIEYPCVYRSGAAWYMLYNGNGFGKSGFGYAIAEQ